MGAGERHSGVASNEAHAGAGLGQPEAEAVPCALLGRLTVWVRHL